MFIHENNIYSDHFQIIDNVEINLEYQENDWMGEDKYSPIKVGETFTDVEFLDYDNNKIKLKLRESFCSPFFYVS